MRDAGFRIVHARLGFARNLVQDCSQVLFARLVGAFLLCERAGGACYSPWHSAKLGSGLPDARSLKPSSLNY